MKRPFSAPVPWPWHRQTDGKGLAMKIPQMFNSEPLLRAVLFGGVGSNLVERMSRVRLATWTMLVVALLGSPRAALAVDDPGVALKFDGVSDFVKLSTNASMMATGWKTTKTVSLWVKPNGGHLTAGECMRLDFGDRHDRGASLRGTVGGNDRIWVWNYDGTVDMVAFPTRAWWIHVALVMAAAS
jgi:hypothetical protein